VSVDAAPCACVDIGSNTTRLLVAECRDAGAIRELMTQRVYTRLGKSLGSDKTIPAPKVDEVAEVVERQVRHARELGAERIRVVATAAIRQAANRADLVAAIEKASGVSAQVLSDDDEARLAFAGATRMLAAPIEGAIAVVDVGGGSTEIAIGSLEEGVTWSQSFRIGSGFLADSYLRSDPPAAQELESVRQHAAGVFEGLRAPAVERGVACGGSAASLRRMAGAELTHDALERAVRLLASAPRAEIAERFELDPERVHLLPAGVLILDAVSAAIGVPLKIGGGGLREGVVLELATGI
jgi:exopolyphosphatase/guanosine-5'-triphosphate,3'-diphosphate pyrophosphatase